MRIKLLSVQSTATLWIRALCLEELGYCTYSSFAFLRIFLERKKAVSRSKLIFMMHTLALIYLEHLHILSW